MKPLEPFGLWATSGDYQVLSHRHVFEVWVPNLGPYLFLASSGGFRSIGPCLADGM